MSAVIQPAAEIDTNLLNQVVRQKKQLYQALKAETAAHKVREKLYKAQIKQIDDVLLKVLRKDTLPTYRSIDAGTVGTTESTKYSVKDRPALEAWIRSSNDLSAFSNSLTKTVIAAYVKQHNALPPGVGAYVERTVTHNTTTS